MVDGVAVLLGIVEVGRGARTLGDIPGKLLFPVFPEGAVVPLGAADDAPGGTAEGARDGMGVGVDAVDVDDVAAGCEGN